MRLTMGFQANLGCRRFARLLVLTLCLVHCLNTQAEQVTSKNKDSQKGVAAGERPAPPSSTPVATESKKGEGLEFNSSRGAREDVPRCLQIAKAIAEILAYILAFLFFLFKSYVGYLTTNLSLTVDCKRYAKPAQSGQQAMDQLSVTASLKKGENGLLRLYLAEARVSAIDAKWEHKKPFDIKRLEYRRGRVLRRNENTIEWDKEHRCVPILQLPPGDATHFACLFEVPSENAYQVDVVIMGKGKFPKISLSQWRASRISLPGEKETK